MKKAFLLFLLFVPGFCFSATFVVTTNIPSGAGSLYDALVLAAQNGDAETDTIRFNLPLLQTTISVNSPYLMSSNLVIDGTTQPTRAFGVTDARVRIITTLCLTAFPIDGQHHIEIYGLWFSGFNYTSISCGSSAISLRNAHYFTLGKPGKGNCFTDNLSCITNPWQLSGDNTENTFIKIQSNRFGIDTTNIPQLKSTNIMFGATRQLLFGGDNVAEGNKIGNGFVQAGNMYIPLSVSGDTIAFKNNSFGFDAYNGDLESVIGLYVAGQLDRRSKLNVVVANNKIGKDDMTSKMWFTDIEGNISIHDNYIGSLNTAVTPGERVPAITMNNCLKRDSIIIRQNTINGYKTAIAIGNSPGVTITRNSIYCNQKGIEYNNLQNVPIVSFLELTSTYVKGSTAPLSTVEIFTTEVCNQYCENGKRLLAVVTADANGIFEYTGSLPPKISATATTPSGTTGEFYGPKFTMANVEVKNATCNLDNGYIKGISIIKGTSFRWEDENGNMVGGDTTLSGMGPGKYRFVVIDSLSSCPAMSPYFTITHIKRPGVDTTFEITNTSCGKAKGKIVMPGAHTPGSAIVWQDSQMNPVQFGFDSVLNLAEGAYYYKIYVPEDSTCFSRYGPFTVLNMAGPALDVSQVQVTASLCNGKTGSVKNVAIENPKGKQYFGWQDSTGKIVANTIDLVNQPGGNYRLRFKDESFCDTLYSPYFTIINKGGITIDSSERMIGEAGCNAPDGYIRQLHLVGADKVEWIAVADGKVVGNVPNLDNVPSGYYKLAIFNISGCTDTSTAMFVPQGGFTSFGVTAADITPPNCDLNNGQVALTFSADAANYQFTWTDSVNNTVVANTPALKDAAAGTYCLTATAANGCKQKIYSSALVQTGKPTFDYNKLAVTHDTCSLSAGAINGLAVAGGQAPYTWQWFKNDNTAPMLQSAAATRLGKGNYHATIKDAYGCAATSRDILVGDFDKQLPAPTADAQSIMRNTTAEIIIKNYRAGSYSLFDTTTASLPVQITSGSRFITPRVLYDKTFYLQYTLGNCVSPLAPVLIKVFDKAAIHVPNAFSPNGDGINDIWKIEVQGLVTIKEWRVFDRYGQPVFWSFNARRGWDGTVNGKPVATGTYYWIITAVDNDRKTIRQNGSVTVLR